MDFITSGTWDLGEPERKRLQAAMNAVRGTRILDVGCRDGTFALTLAKEHPEMNVTAIDIDQKNLDWAQKKAMELGLENVLFWNLDIVTLKSSDGSFDGLTLGEGTFDTVVLMETLEHLPPDKVGVADTNARRFLKPRGRLITTVPANGHISDPDHKNVFYREFIAAQFPKLTWLKGCPFLWIGWFEDLPDGR